MDKRKFQTTIFRFTDEEKHRIIQELLSTRTTYQAIWEKYTGRDREHGKILEWMRRFGYNSPNSRSRTVVHRKLNGMPKKKPDIADPGEESFENLQLKRRIAELEKQLKEAELKAIAFSTMIDLAEREYKIPIKKKFNTKP